MQDMTVFPDTQCHSVTLQNVNAPERVTGLLTRLGPGQHAETERTESEVGLWGVWSFGCKWWHHRKLEGGDSNAG